MLTRYDRAIQYPYHLPSGSYIAHNGEHRLVSGDEIRQNLTGRKPFLAVGSNMSPQQLALKFPGPDDGIIPVTKIKLRDFDSVFSAHFAAYGAIASTLFPAPGTEVTLFINWLDPKQELAMHKTELPNKNYRFCRMNNLQIINPDGPELDYVYVYLSSRGALSKDGDPAPLGVVEATQRHWEDMLQPEIQDYVRSMMAPQMDLAGFIEQNISNPDLRLERTERLQGSSIAIHHDERNIEEIL